MEGVAVAGVIALSLSSCGSDPRTRQLTGAVAGGVAGAAIGSMFGGGSGKAVAIGAGAVLGTIAGCAVTRSEEERVQVSVAPARVSGVPLLKAQCRF